MTQIDMKMPYSCEDCKISRYDIDYDFAFCPFIRDGVTHFVNERHPKCPLKEPKQGEWIEDGDDADVRCSSCGITCHALNKSNHKRLNVLSGDEWWTFYRFCPHCGASMAKEGETK